MDSFHTLLAARNRQRGRYAGRGGAKFNDPPVAIGSAI
jgi:hypothetical protein